MVRGSEQWASNIVPITFNSNKDNYLLLVRVGGDLLPRALQLKFRERSQGVQDTNRLV